MIKGDPLQRGAVCKEKSILRKDGNLLLCTLLLGNVAVNAMLSILTEITPGTDRFYRVYNIYRNLWKIIPQATFSRRQGWCKHDSIRRYHRVDVCCCKTARDGVGSCSW